MRIPAAQREYECGISQSCTLAENMDLFLGLIRNDTEDTWIAGEKPRVFDERTGKPYRLSATAADSGIRDGSTLLVC